MDKAKRVWNGIQAKSHTAIKEVYFAFLSESKGIELLLYRYIRTIIRFRSVGSIFKRFRKILQFKTEQLSKMVPEGKSTELEATLSFQQTKDGVLFATILLLILMYFPLVSKFFRSKYSDRQWMIYDN